MNVHARALRLAVVGWMLGGSGIDSVLAIESVSMVKDINEVPVSTFVHSTPDGITAYQGKAYFTADDGSHGNEVWVSDGTEDGTSLLRDIWSGAEPQGLRNIPVAVVNDTLLINADDGVVGTELWASNGTGDGTVLLKDINFGPGAGAFPFRGKVANGFFYFMGDDGTHGRELWRTDGTAENTEMVMDINPGPGDSEPDGLAIMNGTLYFFADDGIHGRELWASDAFGTRLVSDIAPGDYSSAPVYWAAAIPAVLGDNLFFLADDGVHGQELWKSDGTDAGTVMVKDIGYHRFETILHEPVLRVIGDTLYFFAYDQEHGTQLWRSDGTEAGTFIVRDLLTEQEGYIPHWLWDEAVTVAGNTLYFVVTDRDHGEELWRSDGTYEGTVMVKDINPGEDDATPRFFEVIGNVLYFAAVGPDGDELWRSDGTAAGTWQVKDIQPGGIGSHPYGLTDVDGTLFLAAWGPNGYELWKSDGSDAGTVQVKDIREDLGTRGSYPDWLTDVGGTLMFTADNGYTGTELWRSDGTEAGTQLVKDIVPGSFQSSPKALADVEGTLFLSASDSLWRSDGTAFGTTQVDNDGTPLSATGPWHLTNVAGELFFVAGHPTNGRELWKSNALTGGRTGLIQDINPGPEGSDPRLLTDASEVRFDGKILFVASHIDYGEELWRTSGGDSEALLVKDIRPGPEGSIADYTQMTGANGLYFFVADDGVHGFELWKTDGSREGTSMVKDIYPGSEPSHPWQFVNVDNSLYFLADDGVHGDELWATDGTEAGTVMVKDIRPGPEQSRPVEMTAIAGTSVFFFFADDGEHGYELWRSDGTESGTWMLKDLAPNRDSLYPQQLTNVDGTLFFVTQGLTRGYELWRSYGAGETTIRLVEFPDTIVDHRPTQLTGSGGSMFFVVDDGQGMGKELWKSSTETWSGLALEMQVNGENADVAPGVEVLEGDSLYFSYQLTNLGNRPLTNVKLVDDNATPGDDADDFSPGLVSGDVNGNLVLDQGEVWLFEATAVAATGQYASTAKVTAQPPTGDPAIESDPGHYLVLDATGVLETALDSIDALQLSSKHRAKVVAHVNEAIELLEAAATGGSLPLSERLRLQRDAVSYLQKAVVILVGQGGDSIAVQADLTTAALFVGTQALEQVIDSGTADAAQVSSAEKKLSDAEWLFTQEQHRQAIDKVKEALQALSVAVR